MYGRRRLQYYYTRPDLSTKLNQRLLSPKRTTYLLSFVFSVVIHYTILNVVALETDGNCLFFSLIVAFFSVLLYIVSVFPLSVGMLPQLRPKN